MPAGKPPRAPLHRRIHQTLAHEIATGRWSAGERLPSEAELGVRFGASRITVGRAVRDLQLAGLVERRAGSGTFVKTAAPPTAAAALSFGLLIPDLGVTEIFEPICQGMMASPLAQQHALLWGSLPAGAAGSATRAQRAWDLCRQYIARKVAGVFFAPLELTPEKDEINRAIAQALDDAGVPVVLLDRTVLPYPQRGHHDLVGIDNRRAGYLVTEHLLQRGARAIAFLGLPNAAATVDARLAGYREALYAANVGFEPARVHRIDPTDVARIKAMMKRDRGGHRPDGMVCANDATAARVMQTLLGLGIAIPDDVRLVGIDDVGYASLLPVPLTTLRQPTRDIGAAALAAMLDRIAGSDLPTRDILLQGTLIVRKSCGAPAPTRG